MADLFQTTAVNQPAPIKRTEHAKGYRIVEVVRNGFRYNVGCDSGEPYVVTQESVGRYRVLWNLYEQGNDISLEAQAVVNEARRILAREIA